MIRYILFIILFFVLYYAVKTVVRAAVRTLGKAGQENRLPGDEMVLDPECRTYVVKRRAVTRRIRGKACFFCSEACAEQYEQKNRS
jgi:YHS domain-containing protein